MTAIAVCKILVSIYKKESKCVVRQASISFAPVYQTNFLLTFVTFVLWMWKCLSIKYSEICYMLLDDNRKQRNKTRIFGLTAHLSNSLRITLNEIVKLIMLLLTKIKYVLTVEFQSGRIEGQFGIY